MKRFSFATILILLLQNFAHGQTSDAFRRLRFGVLAGPHFAFSVPKMEDVSQTNGFTTALDVSYALQNSQKGWSLRFQPGINRLKTNQKNGVQGSDYYVEWKWKTTTINLPLLVRYTILDGKVRPFAELGASYLAHNFWKVKGRGQTCMDGTCYPNDFDEKGNGDIDRGRFSALASVGVEFNIGKVTIPVMVRWNEQLQKIEKFNDIVTGSEYTIPRSRAIQVMVGINF